MVHAAEVENLSPGDAWKKVEQGALFIDVRTAEEVASGTFKDALHIPHEQIASEIAKLGTAKDREIVLYCRSGNRSGRAAEALHALGFSRVYNAGGYAQLVQAKPASRELR